MCSIIKSDQSSMGVCTDIPGHYQMFFVPYWVGNRRQMVFVLSCGKGDTQLIDGVRLRQVPEPQQSATRNSGRGSSGPLAALS